MNHHMSLPTLLIEEVAQPNKKYEDLLGKDQMLLSGIIASLSSVRPHIIGISTVYGA